VSKGYTEPDPRDDLAGADVGRKALILGRLLGFSGELDDVIVEPLLPNGASKMPGPRLVAEAHRWDGLWQERLEAARRKKGSLRYVASVTRSRVRVGLAVVGPDNPLAALKGTDNQVAFYTKRYRNPLVITGAGAGLAVTAGGVLNDILEPVS
jgi:homoserine dehydrogenase